MNLNNTLYEYFNAKTSFVTTNKGCLVCTLNYITSDNHLPMTAIMQHNNDA